MVYIRKEKPNGNITDDRKAYYKAYYQAKKARQRECEKPKINITADKKAYYKAWYEARKLKLKPAGYVEETGEIIVWVGLNEKALRKEIAPVD